MARDYDLFVIGGGINGCGIARDAAGRGYSVCLAEMTDLASGTSSASTKLVHGGLRYLEYREFRLVREALIEREVLWANAPHIIRPMRFVLPHHRGLRPAWLLRLGLFLYDHLGGRRRLPPTRTIDLSKDPAGRPLKPGFRRAFEYSDCWVDDARLVVLNARDAADRGATIRTRTRVVSARREGDRWRIALRNEVTGASETVTASLLVNASGPWVDEVLDGVVGINDARNVRLVQGSHIVVRKLFEGERSYIFQNKDGRIVFAIPYEDEFTLIGTTDLDYVGDPATAAISEVEIDYLCAAVSDYFARKIGRNDIVSTYSGVRPLYDDGASKAQEATRDYVLKAERPGDGPALLNIFGGKITTYRRLAEAVVAMIEDVLGARGPAWTAKAPLPGGDFEPTGRAALASRIADQFPFLERATAARFARQYGTRSFQMLDDATARSDLGRHFGADLYEREVVWLIEQEWARSVDDVIWRRTKLGLRLDASEKAGLADFLAARLATGSIAPAPKPVDPIGSGAVGDTRPAALIKG
ncbi:MAG: glycerol-3-phosphate dehydrogenase [Rhodospirillaceae bacterium]|nr:glycerol-3-phosphate dehydrogenase [Rhodospirillaceae bacterium]